MFTFTKVSSKTYEVKIVWLGFISSFEIFQRTRKDITECGFCNNPFEQEDKLNLAFVEKYSNEVICDSCAKMALGGGAEKYYLSK